MKLIIYYYTFAVLTVVSIWICYDQLGTPDYILSNILTVIFLTYGLILRVIPSNRLQVFLGLIAISSGFYGFKYLSINEYSFVNTVYSTFRLFLLDVDPVFSETSSKFTSYPFSIELARFTAAACTLSTVFLLVYSFFNQSMKLLWHKIFGGHIVISGYNKHSKVLIENLRMQQKQVMLLTEEISESQNKYLQNLGVIIFIGKQGEPSLYKQCRLLQAEVFIIFHEDDSKNLNEILALNEFVKKDWSRLRAKQVILHLVHNQYYELFELIEEDLLIHKKVNVKLFNLHHLSAEKVLDNYPLYDNYEDRVRQSNGQPLHLLFIGFDQTGRHMAIQAIERSHFINSELLKITVLDKEIQKVQKLWFDSYPKSQKFVDIRFQKIDIEINSIYTYLQKTSCKFTHVFICLKDDFQDLKEGMELTRKVSDIPIYLKISEEGPISEWLQENQTQFKNLHLFGDVQSTLNYDNVINDSRENLAKRVHESYQRIKEDESGKISAKWDNLPNFKKESNRHQLNHAFVKLMLLGLQAVKKDQIRNQKILTSYEFEKIALSQIEAIAMVEHKRWNTFHYIRGWDTLELISKDYVIDLEKKLHGCIVPYGELDRVSAIQQEDYKKYDRDVVLKLYETMEIAGFGIVKASRNKINQIVN